jgi:hypothetical protein
MKTSEYQKRAYKAYYERLKKSGYKRVSFLIKDEWKEEIMNFIKSLKKKDTE